MVPDPIAPLVVRADARRLPLPDESVDLLVTSPPYFALRDYRDSGGSLAGQIGSEPTPAEYIAALVECTREWTRVLKPTGSMFVMLGDKYGRRGGDKAQTFAPTRERGAPRYTNTDGEVPQKSLMLLPERYRIACVDQLGLIARAVIGWNKPNGLPESVTDRVRRSHEDVVHLTKLPRYFAAVDEIREPHAAKTLSHRGGGQAFGNDRNPDNNWGNPNDKARIVDPLGKLPGSVWTIATEPLPNIPGLGDAGDEHYAAFPTEWPRRLILGWSPSGICTVCGEGRRPVTRSLRIGDPAKAEKRLAAADGALTGGTRRTSLSDIKGEPSAVITGYACACTPYTDHPGTGGVGDQRRPYSEVLAEGRYPSTGVLPGGALQNRERVGPWREYHLADWAPPPTRPAVCVDPFGGTGTTAHVAAALGRIGISVDLSGGYARRYATSAELAAHRRRKVLGLDKPVVQVVPEGQLGLSFTDDAGEVPA